MIVNIKPRVGIICDEVLIKYGMTRQSIQEAFGIEPAIVEIDNVMEEIRERRFGMVFTYEKGKLIHIEVSLNVKLMYKEIDIFGLSNSVELLSKYDIPTSNVGKYMNFYKLGIMLGGFGKRKIPEKKLAYLYPQKEKDFFVDMYKIGGGK